jgi:hypothetical protein
LKIKRLTAAKKVNISGMYSGMPITKICHPAKGKKQIARDNRKKVRVGFGIKL